jgi:hypothetical protein
VGVLGWRRLVEKNKVVRGSSIMIDWGSARRFEVVA